MGITVSPEDLIRDSRVFRAAAVKRVEWDPDGRVSAIEWYPSIAHSSTWPSPPETERSPGSPADAAPPASTAAPDTEASGDSAAPSGPAPSEEPISDPHPDLLDDDETTSDRIARENGWLRRHSGNSRAGAAS